MFTASEDWTDNAHLDFLTGDRWDLLASAYRNAADTLVYEAQQNRSGIDSKIFPIAFLYRHYLELRLKQLIQAGSRLLDKNVPNWGHHYLDTLWLTCRPILDEIAKMNGDNIDSDCDKLERVLNEFSAVDAGSYSFRYPTDKKGNQELDDLSVVGLSRLKSIIDNAAVVLEGGSILISVLEDYRNEMEAEHREAMWHDVPREY